MSEEIKQGEIEITSTEELNKKISELTKDPSLNKPSEEEIEQAKVEFEEAVKDWKAGKSYEIGKPEQAQEIYDYITHFIRNRFVWQKDAWLGVIKLSEELQAAEELFKGKKNAPLVIGYQALEFVYYAFTNPGGIGLQSALDFEQENELFAKSATAIAEQLETARADLKNLEFLQQRWGAMSQGFYLEIEPPADEDDAEGEELLTEE